MKIDDRQKLLVIVAATAAGLWIGDQILIEPLIHLWSRRSAAMADLQKQVDEGRGLISNERRLRRRWDEMRTNALPANASLAEQQVLRSVDGWSRDSGATLTSIAPQWKEEEDDLTTLETRVEASGNLASLTRFVYDFESSPAAIRISAIELSSRDSEGRELTISLQASGLVLNTAKP